MLNNSSLFELELLLYSRSWHRHFLPVLQGQAYFTVRWAPLLARYVWNRFRAVAFAIERILLGTVIVADVYLHIFCAADTIVSIRKNVTGRNCRCACGEAKEKEALKKHIADVNNNIKNVFRDQNLLGKKIKENEWLSCEMRDLDRCTTPLIMDLQSKIDIRYEIKRNFHPHKQYIHHNSSV